MAKRKNDQGSRWTPVYAWLAILSFCAAGITLFYDCYAWFNTGEWKPLGVLDAVERWEIAFGSESDFFRLRDWLSQWSGLVNVLDFFPTSGVFAIVCLIFVALAVTD